jgi:hypothetical protein
MIEKAAIGLIPVSINCELAFGTSEAGPSVAKMRILCCAGEGSGIQVLEWPARPENQRTGRGVRSIVLFFEFSRIFKLKIAIF